MFLYLSALLRDVCDFSFKSALGCHALILSMIEERQVTWDDLPAIQALRENYSYRSGANANPAINKGQTSPRVKSAGSKHRVCRSYNSGTCNKSSSHGTNGISYQHICNYCSVKCFKSHNPETNCRKKEGLQSTDAPSTT